MFKWPAKIGFFRTSESETSSIQWRHFEDPGTMLKPFDPKTMEKCRFFLPHIRVITPKNEGCGCFMVPLMFHTHSKVLSGHLCFWNMKRPQPKLGENITPPKFNLILLMEEIPNNHLTCIKPCKWWDIYQINWLAGFLPSTVCFLNGILKTKSHPTRLPCQKFLAKIFAPRKVCHSRDTSSLLYCAAGGIQSTLQENQLDGSEKICVCVIWVVGVVSYFQVVFFCQNFCRPYVRRISS